MARISSPLEGQIININAQTVSRQVISGGGGRGVDVGGGGGGGAGTERGGAIVVRPQTSLVDRAQNLQIQSGQQSVANLQSLVTFLQNLIEKVNVEVLGINNGLKILNGQIANDTALEQQSKKAELENDRKLNERKIRIGKERQLERRIQSVLLRPVAIIQKNVENIFGRIMKAIGFMFLGWLTNQGIEALKASAEGNKTKLELIFRSVTNGIIVAARGFIFVNKVFGLITRVVLNITKGIVKLTAGLIGGLFRGIVSLSKFVGEGIKSIFTGGKMLKPAATAAGAAAKAGIKATAGKIPVLSLATGLIFGTGRLLTGDPLGAGMEYASGLAATLPGWGTGLSLTIDTATAARDFGAFKGTPFEKKQPDTVESTPGKPGAYPETKPPAAKVQPQTPAAPAPAPAAVQPQTPAVPPPPSAEMSKKFQMAWDNRDNPLARGRIESAWNNMTPEQQQQAKDWAKSEGHDWTKMRLKSKEVAIQSPNKPAADLGSLPEPKPNVIVTAPPNRGNQVPPAQQVEPAGDTPLIQSSNPSNFYSLYSQLSYNVVM